MRIAVSVIIATYNAEKYLEGCLDSLCAQTFTSYEVIIVDGASKDNTLGIIKDYSLKHPLKWVSEPDTGIYDAWNKGIGLSCGEWITFVGSDDVMSPDWLNVMVKHINENPILNFVSAITTITDEFLNPLRKWGSQWNGKKIERYLPIAHVGSFHKRLLFDQFGMFDVKYKIVADYEFLLRASSHIKAGFVDKVIGSMREGGASDTIWAILESSKAQIATKRIARVDVYCQLIYAILALWKRSIFKLI